MLTPDAKSKLATTIRALRTRLLEDIHSAAEGRYRLSVSIGQAGLDEAHRKRRERLDAWLDEKTRTTTTKSKKEADAARARFRASAEKEAAATFLNRIVVVRLMEARGLLKPKILTGGWNSLGYREFRDFAPALVNADETGGMEFLVRLVFDELALDLPGLFGDVGLTKLFPIPPATLREVIERFEDPAIESAWDDDTTLGWIYQYWNDPEREALDAKIADGGKIEPHEIASKTQMFTERYMVEWLLQNSLGLLWLCICRKNGWTPDADSVLPALDARRAEWRKKRDVGEVPLDALMPMESELEGRWKYFVPQPIPDDAVEGAPASARDIKLLDPACGSGHFLVIAFDLLAAMYSEEARHRGTSISDRDIAESILENNLYGVDIDPRAVQIAAAALLLKARTFARDARPRHVHLVAPILQLATLPKNDPALVQLRTEIRVTTGIPEALTDKIVTSLAGVDHLGTLLKVDTAVDDAIAEYERTVTGEASQGDLFKGYKPQQIRLAVGETRATVIEKLGRFLSQHAGEQDLGLRLDGEQLAAGVRFARIVREGAYDVVVGNPPYQGTSKMADAAPYARLYPAAKADLFAGFYLRGLELTRTGGLCGYVTLSNWMFLGTFGPMRSKLLAAHLTVLADFGKAAFSTGGTLISTSAALFENSVARGASIALRPHAPSEVVRDDGQPLRTEAALLAQRGRFEFQTQTFDAVAGKPLVYFWGPDLLAEYASLPKLGDRYAVRQGMATGDNTRFLRFHWELPREAVLVKAPDDSSTPAGRWAPYVKGAAGQAWFEGLSEVVRWEPGGLQIKLFARDGEQASRPQNEAFYFRRGVAFTSTGSTFAARLHRFASVFDVKGQSVFPPDPRAICCAMNTTRSRMILESLNPSVSFQVGDANRLPIVPVESSDAIFVLLDRVFTEHESGRETSIEFRRPTSSEWASAQEWAQRAVDRPLSEPLPSWEPSCDLPAIEAPASFAFGMAIGRFDPRGAGILTTPPTDALPAGIMFLSAASERDSLAHQACAPLLAAWAEHGAQIARDEDLRSYLRKSFFTYHKDLYENRPIYFPLSSAKKNFVAFVSIHRFAVDTLSTLLADHLQPERRALEGELDDLRRVRSQPGASKAKAEKRYADVQKLLEELNAFIDAVTACAEHGPPPPDDKTATRETDARHVMDLDDGVMVNSAALWPLLEPQWKDPKKWWKELANAQGRKDYDWSHLAARYFPKRVAEKCEKDPSLAVAHKCFWQLHPAKAYAWELRLQDEIRPDFTIDEPGSDEAREQFLREHRDDAKKICDVEVARRERKLRRQDESNDGPLLNRELEPEENAAAEEETA